jgi:hypothetical protein
MNDLFSFAKVLKYMTEWTEKGMPDFPYEYLCRQDSFPDPPVRLCSDHLALAASAKESL